MREAEQPVAAGRDAAMTAPRVGPWNQNFAWTPAKTLRPTAS